MYVTTISDPNIINLHPKLTKSNVISVHFKSQSLRCVSIIIAFVGPINEILYIKNEILNKCAWQLWFFTCI